MRGYNDAPNIPPPAPQNIAYRDVVLRIRARSPSFFDSDEVLLLLEKSANEIERLRAEIAECHFKREEAAEQFSKAYGLLIAERDECLQTIARLDEANLCMHTELATLRQKIDSLEPVAWMDTRQVITYGQHNLSDIPLFTHPPTIDPISKCPNCGAPLICNKCTNPALAKLGADKEAT